LGRLQGGDADDLDFLEEHCIFRITGHANEMKYVSYAELQQLAEEMTGSMPD